MKKSSSRNILVRHAKTEGLRRIREIFLLAKRGGKRRKYVNKYKTSWPRLTSRRRQKPSYKSRSSLSKSTTYGRNKTSERSPKRPLSGRNRSRNNTSHSISLVIRPRLARQNPSSSTSRLPTLRVQKQPLYAREGMKKHQNFPAVSPNFTGKSAVRSDSTSKLRYLKKQTVRPISARAYLRPLSPNSSSTRSDRQATYGTLLRRVSSHIRLPVLPERH